MRSNRTNVSVLFMTDNAVDDFFLVLVLVDDVYKTIYNLPCDFQIPHGHVHVGSVDRLGSIVMSKKYVTSS